MTGPSSSPNMNDSTNNSNTHLRVNVEDAPPPYSETDIYSNASGGRSPRSVGPAHADDAVSSTSAGDPIVYTPPMTPRSSSNSHTFNIPPSPSANLYFDDRPAPSAANPSLNRPVIHRLSVKPESKPDDLPYPPEWANHDVTQQDWATFVNFLIPHHDAEVNEAILGEKVRSDDVPQIRGEKTPTEGSVRSAGTVGRMNDQSEIMRRRAEIEATVQQWNDGFFAPRGVQVQLEPTEDEPRVPGAWDTAFDQAPASGTAQAGPSSEREAGEQAQQQQGGGWRNGFGGFRIDGDSVRWGDAFVADSNGLRIGNLVMDNNGIRMNGRGGMPSGPNTRGAPGFPPQAQWSHPGAGPWAAPHRGRSAVPHSDGAYSRSSSVSSASSSSSDSSDSDASSIGSLPDYDDLRDTQLPLYVERLKSWTASPNRVRTKADVKQLRAELKACKTNSNLAINEMDRSELRSQIKALKQQWRALKKQQKKERKEHKKERRQRRKEERKEKKQRKKEIRRAKKEARRGHRGHAAAPPPPPPPGPIPAPNVNIPHIPPVPPVPQPFGPGSGWGWGWGENRGRGQCDGFGGRGGFFGAQGPSNLSADRNNQGGPFGTNGPFGPHGPFGPNGPLGPHGPLGPNGVFGPQGGCGSRGQRGRRGWGSCGRGGRFPGSWPEDRQAEGTRGESADLPPPGPVSAEKYRTVDGLEEEIEKKQANLTRVSESERRAVEKELEALVEKLDNLRTEADEAYARELQSGNHY